MIQQKALDAPELRALVESLAYRPGWTFALDDDLDRGQGSVGTTLVITTCGYNAYHPEQGENYRVHHYMPVPPAGFDRRSWQRWLLEQVLLVERHEACEFFALETADRNPADPGARNFAHPYAPHHGPGNDPYIIFEHGTDLDTRTSFRGVVKVDA